MSSFHDTWGYPRSLHWLLGSGAHVSSTRGFWICSCSRLLLDRWGLSIFSLLLGPAPAEAQRRLKSWQSQVLEETKFNPYFSFSTFKLFWFGGLRRARIREDVPSYLSQSGASSLMALVLPSKPLQTSLRLNGNTYAAAGQAGGTAAVISARGFRSGAGTVSWSGCWVNKMMWAMERPSISFTSLPSYCWVLKYG